MAIRYHNSNSAPNLYITQIYFIDILPKEKEEGQICGK